MKLSEGQEKALGYIRQVQKEYQDGGAVGIISGFAGTGKTSLIKLLVEEFEGGLLVVTPTGKAAVRVREVSGAQAQTIHSWLYEVTEDEETGIIDCYLRKTDLISRPSSGLVIVDEASMVTLKLYTDLRRLCKQLKLNLILIGDGFQLPPVDKDSNQGFSVFVPDMPCTFRVNLTEIHRQALDSPIVKSSMEIRTGKWVGESLSQLPVIVKSKLNSRTIELLNADDGVVICHRNNTRNQLNRDIRKEKGFADYSLNRGEPLLVTQNQHTAEIFNGEIIEMASDVPRPLNIAPVAVRDNYKKAATHVNFWEIDVQTALKGTLGVIVCDKGIFGTLGEVGPHIVRRKGHDLRLQKYGRRDGMVQGPPYLDANFGYALTAHKAQGSSWRRGVVVIEPSLKMDSEDGRRWVYTAITRFEKEVEICWM